MLSRAAAAGLAGLGLALLLSWLAALAMNHDVLPGTDVRLAALVCCGLACLAAGALSPRPEQGRALGGAMTWAVWAIGYLILKAAVGAQVFCAATAMTLLTALAATIVGSCIFHKKLRNRTKKKKTSVYKGYKQDKIEMRGDRAEMSDFPLYLNTVAGGLDRRDQTIGGFSFVVKIYALPVVEIIG